VKEEKKKKKALKKKPTMRITTNERGKKGLCSLVWGKGGRKKGGRKGVHLRELRGKKEGTLRSFSSQKREKGDV